MVEAEKRKAKFWRDLTLPIAKQVMEWTRDTYDRLLNSEESYPEEYEFFRNLESMFTEPIYIDGAK